MKKNNTSFVYLVIACDYGGFSQVLGVFDNEQTAISAAREAEHLRSGIICEVEKKQLNHCSGLNAVLDYNEANK